MNKARINLFALAQRLDILKRSARTREVAPTDATTVVAANVPVTIEAGITIEAVEAADNSMRLITRGDFPVCDYLYSDVLAENDVVMEPYDNQRLEQLIRQSKFWREALLGTVLLTLLALIGLLLITIAPLVVPSVK
ncbi:MAG: hypothetical protein P4L77_12185 [Sulfuriferula sp.]|nr:hypothetical protein [Sulfuriferula sp.]